MIKSSFAFTAIALTALFGFSSVQAQGVQTTRPDQRAQQTDRVQADQYGSEAGIPLTQALAKKLMKANDGEIELAKMAQQKIDNQDVQQLTKMIIADHQAMNAELKKLSDTNRPQTARAEQPSDQQDPTGDRRANGQTTTRAIVANSPLVPKVLCDIGEQACTNNLEMTKKMFGEYSGQDLQMAFLGQQCVAHTMMLAELKAIQSNGPEELQAIVEQAIPKVEAHLTKVKQLAKQFEQDNQTRG